MLFQSITLTAILATAIALPLPDMMGRQLSPDLSGAVSGAISGILGAVTGGIAGTLGATGGAIASIGAVPPVSTLPT